MLFAPIGRFVLDLLRISGQVSLFGAAALRSLFAREWYLRLLLQQAIQIGYYSLPVVAMTAFFTGGVLALQIYYGGNQFNSEVVVASVVALGITRELGPVLSGLMVAGRSSAAMAAELGTMRVTEQIDALVSLSTKPINYLVVPRVVAATLTMPLLALVADIIGIFGGYVVAVLSLDFNGAVYMQKTIDFLEWDDIVSGLIKAAVFGFIIALMGCYHGYHSRGGAQGVGRATTNAVMASSVLILAANYLMTSLFFSS